MATYRRKGASAPALIPFEFDTYNAAVQFCKVSAPMNPSRPFQKGKKWGVSVVNPVIPQPVGYVKVEDWKKPGVYMDGKLLYSSNDEWATVEGLEAIPEPIAEVAEEQIWDMVQRAQKAKQTKQAWAPLPKHVYDQAQNGFGTLPRNVYEQAGCYRSRQPSRQPA